MQFYNLYLNNNRKNIVSDLADGTSKLTIGKNQFKQYYIEYISKKEQDDFVQKYLIPYNVVIDDLKIFVKEKEKDIKYNFRKLIYKK